MDGLISKYRDFKHNSEFDEKSVKLLNDRGDIIREGGSSHDAGWRNLEQLKFMEFFGCRPKAGIYSSPEDQAVHHNGGGLRDGCTHLVLWRWKYAKCNIDLEG